MRLQLTIDQEKTLIKLLGFKVELEDLIIEYGLLKLSQKKFSEARILFTKSTQATEKSFIAHLNLGISCMHIQQYENACRSLSSANILDPSNQAVWIYLCLIALKTSPTKPSPDLQACLREALKLEVEDEQLILTLAHQLFNQNFFRECRFVSKRIEKHYAATSAAEEAKEQIHDLIGKCDQHINDEDYSPYE